MIGFLGIKLPNNSLTKTIVVIAFFGFLIFSASFGFGYFFIGLFEMSIGAGVAMLMTPKEWRNLLEKGLTLGEMEKHSPAHSNLVNLLINYGFI